MKTIALFAFALLLLGSACFVDGIEHYSTKYDNINIDEILNNNRLTTNYVKCVLDQGKCNDLGKAFKSVFPDALQTKCTKCNDHQKVTVRKVAMHFFTKRRSDWNAIVAKYDPQGKYKDNFNSFLQ